jgi:hypothetical protein
LTVGFRVQIAVTPVLEKLSLYLSSESNKLRQTLGRNHDKLTNLRIYGFPLVGPTRSLEQLMLDT